ncbi:MAG: phosphatidate cytidylyltransferase [Bacilli bacterium]
MMDQQPIVKKRSTSTLKISLNEISQATKKSMLLRIMTSIVLAIIVIPAVFMGGWYFLALVFVASIIAVYEITHGTKISRKYWYIYFLTIFSALALTFWMFIKVNIAANVANGYPFYDVTKWVVENGFDAIRVSSFLLASILIGLFVLLVWDKQFNFDIAAYLFLLVLFAGFGFQAFLFLRLYPQYVSNNPILGRPAYDPTIFTSSFLLIFVIMGAVMNDIGAYFIGVLFGKNKMIPRISPNKTWEGFFGGVFFAMLSSFLFGMIVSWAGHPILPFLTHNEWYYILLLAFVMPFAAVIGDLFFSATKRYLKIKDYGFIIVGHGGILDRIDSLLLVSVVVAMLVILINNGWSLLL